METNVPPKDNDVTTASNTIERKITHADSANAVQTDARVPPEVEDINSSSEENTIHVTGTKIRLRSNHVLFMPS